MWNSSEGHLSFFQFLPGDGHAKHKRKQFRSFRSGSPMKAPALLMDLHWAPLGRSRSVFIPAQVFESKKGRLWELVVPPLAKSACGSPSVSKKHRGHEQSRASRGKPSERGSNPRHDRWDWKRCRSGNMDGCKEGGPSSAGTKEKEHAYTDGLSYYL